MTDDAVDPNAPTEPLRAADPDAPADPDEPIEGQSPAPEEPEERKERTLGRDLIAAGALALTLAAFGFPFAMLWQVITPRVEFITVEGGWLPTEANPDGYVLADLSFAGIGLVCGIAAALIAWAAMSARRGPTVMFGLVVGSVACQVIAWRIGTAEWESFWDAVRAAPPGVRMWRPPSVLYVELHPSAAWEAIKAGNLAEAIGSLQLGGLGIMALAAVFTYTVCAGWSRRPSLRSGVPE